MRSVRAFKLGMKVEGSKEVERLEGELRTYASGWKEVLERRGARIQVLEARLREVRRPGGVFQGRTKLN